MTATGRRVAAVALAMVVGGGAAAPSVQAQAVPSEVRQLGEVEITLHLHGFLDAEARQFLEIIATVPEALEVMTGGADASGHAAMAAAPDEGVLQGGVPPESLHAVAQLPDADSARAEALAGCDGVRQGGAACVVVLEVAPAR